MDAFTAILPKVYALLKEHNKQHADRWGGLSLRPHDKTKIYGYSCRPKHNNWYYWEWGVKRIRHQLYGHGSVPCIRALYPRHPRRSTACYEGLYAWDYTVVYCGMLLIGEDMWQFLAWLLWQNRSMLTFCESRYWDMHSTTNQPVKVSAQFRVQVMRKVWKTFTIFCTEKISGKSV